MKPGARRAVRTAHAHRLPGFETGSDVMSLVSRTGNTESRIEIHTAVSVDYRHDQQMVEDDISVIIKIHISLTDIHKYALSINTSYIRLKIPYSMGFFFQKFSNVFRLRNSKMILIVMLIFRWIRNYRIIFIRNHFCSTEPRTAILSKPLSARQLAADITLSLQSSKGSPSLLTFDQPSCDQITEQS